MSDGPVLGGPVVELPLPAGPDTPFWVRTARMLEAGLWFPISKPGHITVPVRHWVKTSKKRARDAGVELTCVDGQAYVRLLENGDVK